MDSPFGMLAELTYRCPLACPYCSNPLNMADYRDELSTQEWQRVLVEARDLGSCSATCPAGEPLLRRDLVEIVTGAHRARPVYQPHHQRPRVLAAEGRAAAGRRARPRPGQHPVRRAGRVDRIAGTPSFDRKIEAMGVVKELGWPLTMNVVLHRQNIDRVADLSGWRRRSAPTGWSWPTPSTTAGPGATATRCCPPGTSSRRPSSSCGPRASGCGTASTSSTSSPTTTAATRSPAWVAGRPGS
jgi:hypothetical protein